MDEYPKAYFYRRIVAAKLFIDQNYAEKIDLKQISDHGAYSKYHFVREFKKVYGKTPKEYLKIIRIEKAKILLKENKTVTFVCLESGYESVSSFSTTFKKLVGVSPKKFQSNFIKRQNMIESKPTEFIPACIVKNLKR